MELIDRILDEFKDINYAYNDCTKFDTLKSMLSDAVPVRHGEWKPFDLTYGRSVYSCSVCEQATEVPMCMGKPMYAYCPNCGARMDGERRDGE